MGKEKAPNDNHKTGENATKTDQCQRNWIKAGKHVRKQKLKTENKKIRVKRRQEVFNNVYHLYRRKRN